AGDRRHDVRRQRDQQEGRRARQEDRAPDRGRPIEARHLGRARAEAHRPGRGVHPERLAQPGDPAAADGDDGGEDAAEVADEVVPLGATKATPQMQKIRGATPDAMFVAGVVTATNVLIFKSYRELGLKFPIHASYNLSVPIYETAAKGLVDGITFVDAYDPEKAEVKAFEAAYRKETGKEPVNLHGYGYDGIMMVAAAI